MTFTVVTICDLEEVARAIDRYLHCFFEREVQSYFMPYGQSFLSASLLRRTDLFILGLFRHDSIGLRAEGIFTAEKFLGGGHRVLLVSGDAISETLAHPLYWDLAATDALSERVRLVLEMRIPTVNQLGPLRTTFRPYCRPAIDHHH